MLVSYFACQGRGCQMRSMLLLTKYNLFLHYRANTSCGSWVGYNSECHWMMDRLRSENEANNTEQHSAKHKQTQSREDVRDPDQSSSPRPELVTESEPLTVTRHWKLCHLTGGPSQPWLWPQQCCSELWYTSDDHTPRHEGGLNLNNYDFVGTDQ